jgi:hypothetical protein
MTSLGQVPALTSQFQDQRAAAEMVSFFKKPPSSGPSLLNPSGSYPFVLLPHSSTRNLCTPYDTLAPASKPSHWAYMHHSTRVSECERHRSALSPAGAREEAAQLPPLLPLPPGSDEALLQASARARARPLARARGRPISHPRDSHPPHLRSAAARTSRTRQGSARARSLPARSGGVG